MQPQEPTTGGVPPQPAGTPRNRRKRLWLAMGLGIAALLCLGGVGVFVSLYDSATAIKRSAPDAVVDSFLRAYLVNRDDNEVSLYTCRSGGDLAAISALRTESINRERNFGVKVVVRWSGLAVSGTSADQRTVTTDLSIAGTKNGEIQSRRSEHWQLGLIQDDGWRVCSARKVS